MMDTQYSDFEILQIAEQVDGRGARFYVTAAEHFADRAIKDLLQRMAEWKARQQKVWSRMRQDFSERTGEFGIYDPDNFLQSNPQVLAGLTWMGTDVKNRRLTGKESRVEVVKDCMRRENAVITFYHGLKDFARDAATRRTLNRLVAQENQYIVALTEELNHA